MIGSVYIGTSGWSYKYWAKRFYPPGLPAKEQFAYYARHFPTVEINASFYRLPTEAAIAQWRRQAPPGFLYAVKGSRTVTHFFKLRPGAKSFDILLERARALGSHLGPILWQLPPGLEKSTALLEAFAETLPDTMRHAIEFREDSWLSPDVFDVLRRHRLALVSVSSASFPRDLTVTTDVAYIRFHGLEGGPAHDYTRNELWPWARHIAECATHGVQSFAYFNNDANARAPANAVLLRQIVQEELGADPLRAGAPEP